MLKGERAIRTAIEKLLAQGYCVEPNNWGIDVNGVWHLDNDAYPKVCALGAYLLNKPRKTKRFRYASDADDKAEVDAGKYLGINTEEVQRLIIGFDTSSDSWTNLEEHAKSSYRRLGHQLRLDYYESH